MDDEGSECSRSVAFALSLLAFVALCGMHRLYVGRTKSFILQFITVGGLGAWQLVDAVKILLGRFEDAQGRRVVRWAISADREAQD